MKNRLLPVCFSLFLAVTIAAAPGCSGESGDDDDDDDDGPLPSGTYQVENATATDGCGFYGSTSHYASAEEVELVVDAATVQIFGFEDDIEYEINGTLLTDVLFGGVTNFDFTDDASVDYPSAELPAGNEYSCKAQYAIDYRGEITGESSLSLEDEYALVVTSGNECAIALGSAFDATITTLPCITTDTVDLSR